MVYNYCIAAESPCQQQVCDRDVYLNQNLLDYYQLPEWCYRTGSFTEANFHYLSSTNSQNVIVL